MEVFLVRHGQTMGNVAKRHQSDHTPLSKAGEEQAIAVAKKIKELKPTHLISSHFIRAIETARPVSEATGLDMIIHREFAELGRPNYLKGKKHINPRSLIYYFFWFLGFEKKSLAGESYREVRERIEAAKKVVDSYSDDARVVIITHSVFINLFLNHMCRPKPLSTLEAFKFISSSLKIHNTKIIHLTYKKGNLGTCDWEQNLL